MFLDIFQELFSSGQNLQLCKFLLFFDKIMGGGKRFRWAPPDPFPLWKKASVLARIYFTSSGQSLMYIHYDADHTNEVRCLIYYLESAGYVCTCEGDVIEEHRKECVEKSSVILFILTKR